MAQSFFRVSSFKSVYTSLCDLEMIVSVIFVFLQRGPRDERDGTHVFASHTSSLLRPSRRWAHHSALRLIQTSSFLSSDRPLTDMQNLKSSNFGEQSRGAPWRYTDFV